MSGLVADILETALPASTGVALAASGEMFNERAGTLNLGQEGLMSLGAVAAFIVGTNVTQSVPRSWRRPARRRRRRDRVRHGSGGHPRQPGPRRPGARRWWRRVGQPARQWPPGRSADQPVRAGRDPGPQRHPDPRRSPLRPGPGGVRHVLRAARGALVPALPHPARHEPARGRREPCRCRRRRGQRHRACGSRTRPSALRCPAPVGRTSCSGTRRTGRSGSSAEPVGCRWRW